MNEKLRNVLKNIPGFKFLKDKVEYAFANLTINMTDDLTVISAKYNETFNKKLNLLEPKTFNERIQYRILFERLPIYSDLTDKFRVRDYIEEKIGSKYLIPLLGVYKNACDIDFDSLPSQFVLKCNHDSGSVVICEDKSKLNIKSVIRKLNSHLKINYYIKTREWHYNNIKPLIICELFLSQNGHVFKNEKIIIQIDSDRFGKHKRNMKDSDWNELDFTFKIKDKETDLAKPHNFDKMKELAKLLSQDFDYVRVDFYEVENKIYFGELTFTPEGGLARFYPEEWDYKFGEMWGQK